MCRSKKQKQYIDVYSLFVRELRSRLNVCKHIYSNVLFKKLLQKLLKSNYEKLYDICVIIYYLYTLVIPWIINDGFTG